MEAFSTLTAAACPIDIANCDTDQIIPARYLRRPVDDPEYASFLLHDLRFETDGSEKEFSLNAEAFRGSRIIVAERNWGCGSSRENAVTALAANGIRAIIAPSFGDIHYNNCMKRGVLPVRLSEEACSALRAALHADPGIEISIDLTAQRVAGPGNLVFDFDIEPFDKHRMLSGLDDIDLTLEYADAIDAYEKRQGQMAPWA